MRIETRDYDQANGYNGIGNISYKSDVGTYSYGAGIAGPHAVTGVSGIMSKTFAYDANGNMVNRDGDAITWYSFNQPKRIDYGADRSELWYGADRSRYKQVAVDGGATVTTRYIGAHFELEQRGALSIYRHYIRAGGETIAQVERRSDLTAPVHYFHRDHQGSVVATTDAAGAVRQRWEYEAFGYRWQTAGGQPEDSERGYTGHEHLDSVDLIHMNGRVQDPVIGRFISADPWVPSPLDSQSHNRYSYVRNRPLSLIDPSGFQDIETRTQILGLPPQLDDRAKEFFFNSFIRLPLEESQKTIAERAVPGSSALEDAYHISRLTTGDMYMAAMYGYYERPPIYAPGDIVHGIWDRAYYGFDSAATYAAERGMKLIIVQVALTAAMGPAMGPIRGAAPSGSLLAARGGARLMRMPATDATLSGTPTLGYTLPNGSVFIQPGLSRAEQVLVMRHEAVHAWFSPPGSGALATFRQTLGQWGYNNSQLLRYTEEALAQGYATRSIFQGAAFPLANGYVTGGRLLLEGGVVGVGAYGLYELGSR